MVLFGHLPFSLAGGTDAGAGAATYPGPVLSRIFAQGHYGVQLFLVISGYCIHTRWARAADLRTRLAFLPFWRRRLTRLYPPFLVVLAASLAMVVLGHQVSPGTAVSWKQLGIDVVSLLLLVQNFSEASLHVGNPPFWSLALEEHLYLLYFPLLYLRRKFGWTAALVASFVTVVVWLAVATHWNFAVVFPTWQLMAFGYWFCWALGALAAEIHLGHTQAPKLLSSFVVFALGLLAATFGPELLRDFLVTCSFFVLILWVTRLESDGRLQHVPGFRALVGLGEISYGVYRAHLPVFIVSKRLLVMLHMPAPLILVLRGSLGVAAGYVVYRLIERPFIKRSQQVAVPLLSD